MDIRKLADYKKMMVDDGRMHAYAEAIQKTCPDRVVCEIGVGLGPLSLMALQAGATRVYGIELDKEALDAATGILQSNGFGPDRFIPIEGLSTRVTLPERVDVLLSETLDSMGVGENTAHYMLDAQKRHMQPEGVFVPGRLDCHVSLASPGAYRAERAFWGEHLSQTHGLDYSSALAWVANNKHTIAIESSELFSEWSLWQSIDFHLPETWKRVTQLILPVTRDGVVDGFACAFDAELTEGVHIRTFPEDAPTHWMQSFNAFPSVIEVSVGQSVYMELEIARGDHPSLQFEMRVTSGPTDQVVKLVAERAQQLSIQAVLGTSSGSNA
jgi:hypothetical protein